MSVSLQKRNVPYVNPYNTRRKVISKPLLITTLVIVATTWISLSFHIFSHHQDRVVQHPGFKSPVQPEKVDIKGANSDIKLIEKEIKNTKKDIKKKKDTKDYRSIKIETPPPKAKHSPEDMRLDDKIANLTASNPVYVGRERLMKMLLEMWIDPTQIEDSIWEQVPVWDDIVKVHGNAPVIYGLDSCEKFREAVPAENRRVGIAGMFNTGTNLLAILLQHNCANLELVKKLGRKKGHGMEWQVPWGKHTPAWYRGQAHVKNFIGQIPEDNMMVAVMVRHAHDWMASMCRHGYTAKWKRTAKNCPNLYDGNTVDAKFGPGPSHHDSLAHMWNDWNGAYYNASYPRLMLRFEDTIFFPKETSRKVCSCVGGKLITPKEQDGLFHYVIDSAKTGPGHGPGQKRNGLIDAWIKYGKARQIKMGKSDLEFSAKHLRRDIMDSLHWDFPEIPDK